MKTEYALLGYPLGYSLSPALHNTFFKEEGIDAKYISYPVTVEDLKPLFESKKFAGLNVTIPHKENVIPLCDEITDSAKEIGAVNTIKLIEGKYVGTNTDAPGFSLMLKEEANMSLTDKNIFLIGAGGAAKAIVYSSLQAECNKITIFDIDTNKAEEIKTHYQNNTKIIIINDNNKFEETIKKANIIVNATPVGMEKTIDKSVLSKEQLEHANQNCLIVDIIYAPARTKLLQIAEELGLTTLNGLGMLGGQGILGQQFWFSRKLRYNTAKEVLLREIESSIPG